MNKKKALLLPQYASRAAVNAAKIVRVHDRKKAGADLYLEGQDDGEYPVTVSETWAEQHQPQAGGYYVVNQATGKAAYVSAEAFKVVIQ